MQKTIICTTVLVETSPQALPLGAACIASAVKNYFQGKGDFEVFLKDFSLEEENLKNLDDGKMAQKIAENLLSSGKKLYAVLFSVYVWNHKLLEMIAELLKKEIPSLVTIAGGPEVTANPYCFCGFDFAVAGEGEKSVPELLEKILLGSGENQIKIPGVYDLRHSNLASEKKFSNKTENQLLGFNGEKVEKICLQRSEVPSLQTLSSPYLDGTVDPKKYGGALWELARGCPFKCSYCYESKGEKKMQFFPIERLKAELEFFEKEKIPQIFVLDPTYNANKKRALEILKMIKNIAPDIFFYFEARAEFIDKEMARAFASSNCCLQFGLQSSNPEVLKNVNRSFDKKIFSRNIGFLNQEGAVFGFDLIFGLPGDSLSGFKKSIDFAMSLYPNNLELFCLSILPGTDLYDTATNFFLTWQKNPPYHVVDSKTFPPKDLLAAQKISSACNIFYNQGRAVPWFNSALSPLKIRPSVFFTDFASYLEKNDFFNSDGTVKKLVDFDEILKMQINFLSAKYSQAKLENLLFLLADTITLNGAISRFTASGKESVVNLHYHPDDLMSEYACDFIFFAKNCRHFHNRTKVFRGKNGPDWKVLK